MFYMQGGNITCVPTYGFTILHFQFLEMIPQAVRNPQIDF